MSADRRKRGWRRAYSGALLGGGIFLALWCAGQPAGRASAALPLGLHSVRAKIDAAIAGEPKHFTYDEPTSLKVELGAAAAEFTLSFSTTVDGAQYACTVRASPTAPGHATLKAGDGCAFSVATATVKSGELTWAPNVISLTSQWTLTAGAATGGAILEMSGRPAGAPCYTRAEYDDCISICNKKDRGPHGNGCRNSCNGKKNDARDHLCWSE